MNKNPLKNLSDDEVVGYILNDQAERLIFSEAISEAIPELFRRIFKRLDKLENK